jgi:putative addiction module component (TIGR02574 family)
MSMSAKELLEAALELPTKERAKMAGQLLQSLDDEPAEDVEAAWAAEIERRLEDGDEAYEAPLTLEELNEQVRARLKKTRAT